MLIEDYAKENNIPIMQEAGILFLQDFIRLNDIKNILEIGSAIGYSAIKMASIDSNIKITTIERDYDRYNKALDYINEYQLNDQITIINADAFNVKLDNKFDLIFIDAAKAQNQKFFLTFENNLNNNGYIITDNLSFHGLVAEIDSIKSKNLKALVRKINDYKQFLISNNNYKTTFLDIGDGIAISEKCHD